jgi:hypothetical protein
MRPAVITWQGFERDGVKVRTRALTTTMYARLFLADLFLHGIGGAKYDELSDEIIRRFYGYEPPRFLVLTATLLLPLPVHPVNVDHRRHLARLARDLYWNPQRHVGDGAVSDPHCLAVAARKQVEIAQSPVTVRQHWERYTCLRQLTQQLRSCVAERERQARQELAECERQLRDNAVLQRRDYASWLFPEQMLRTFFAPFLPDDSFNP